MPFNQFNDYEPPVSGGTIPIKLPGSYPGKVPQPRGHNPSPLPPPTDYYVTRKEVRDLLAKYPIETLMKLVENATDGNLVTLGTDGQVIDSQVNISVLKAIVGDDSGKSARAIAAEEVATIVDGAPEALDTLKEASDIINRLIEQEQALQTELGTKANKDDVSKAITTVNASLATKADAEDVWLRGDDVTDETNFAHSIKVNEISPLLDDETPGSGRITFNGDIFCPSSQITANSLEAYACYLSEDGWVTFKGYDDNGDYGEHDLGYRELMSLCDNSDYVQANLRGHITHDEVYNEYDGGTYGTITITPVTYSEWGDESSDFYFSSNGNLTMSGTLRCYGRDGYSGGGVQADWVSCSYDVSCSSVYTAYGVDARSRTDEWGGEYGGVIVRDEYDYDTVSSLLAGTLRLGDKNYGDCVEITVVTEGGLSLLFCHQDGEQYKELTFSFSDFAILRDMIDVYNASEGA